MAMNGYRLLCGISRLGTRSTRIFQQSVQVRPCVASNWQSALYMSSGAEPKQSGSSQSDLLLSDSCVKQLHKLGAKEDFLRVLVEGGGCSGFQYKFELDSQIMDEDKVFERDGVKVVVDEVSLEYIKGSTIDYHEELIRSAFRVIDNPGAEMGCSCGASFSFKL